jgi:hypothetical protein
MEIEEVEQAIRSRWDELEREWNGQFITMQLPLIEKQGVRIGLDEEKRLCAIIDIPGNAELSDYVQISAGLFISIQNRDIQNQEQIRFIVAIDSDSELVYSAFLADFLLNVDSTNPQQSFEDVYKKWKKKWSGVRKPIGPREEEGLIGEISVLMQLVEHVDGAEKLVEAWVGPFKSNHDFEANLLHVEVKTTTRDPPVVRISKLEQLAPRDTGRLDLVVVQMEVIDGAATLPMMVNKMLKHEKLSPHLEALLERLEKVGYSDKHRLHYTRGFKVGHYTCCPIDEETPIMPPEILSDLPSTVSHIRYSLHIKGLKRSTMTKEMWIEITLTTRRNQSLTIN